MSAKDHPIGLISGGGQFPVLIAEAAKRKGERVAAIGHIGETSPELAEKVDSIAWINLGEFGKLIKELKKQGVRKALMAGTIKKKRMFEGVRPDLKGLALMSKLAIFHDDGILRSVAKELEEEGIDIISSTWYLPELTVLPGYLTRCRPNKSQKEDVRFGWSISKELGRLDIGQCVVVRHKTILAVEAMEGTDETVRRGGALAGEKAVVVKTSKPGQDLRFDVPTVGLQTLETMFQVRASVLAFEANKTLVFDRDEMLKFAEKRGIAVVSCDDTLKPLM